MKPYRFSLLLISLLLLLWVVVFQRSAAQKTHAVAITMLAPLPYGASEEQLKSDLNQALSDADNLALALRDFFQETGQYSDIAVRCASEYACTVEGTQSTVLAQRTDGELLLSAPLRWVPNPYQHSSPLTLTTAVPLSEPVAKICQLYHEGFFSQRHPDATASIEIFAEQTTLLTLHDLELQIWFWPLESVPQKWDVIKTQLPSALMPLQCLDTRYPHGFSYELKNKKKK